jgi:hypothetical protein
MAAPVLNENLKQAPDAWPLLRVTTWVLMLVSWLVQAVSYPHSTMPDSLSYMDIGLACSKGHWQAIVNAYWSPGYSAILAVWFRLLRPSPYKEVLSVHLLNCLLLVGGLVCLEYFLFSLCRYVGNRWAKDELGEPPCWMIKSIGFVVFFWTSLYMTPPSLDTPDALVMAIVLLSAAIILEIATGNCGWFRFVLLGVVLGFGYLVKAVMFPLALVFIAFSVFAVGNWRRAAPKLAISFLTFLLVSGPFIFALSKSKGRFTYNDTGAIAYAEYVNGITLFVHWQGGPEGAGTPKHPTRKVFENPDVYEYAEPIGGCYPPWTDPSYWYDGVRPHFQLKNQLKAMRLGFDSFFGTLQLLGSLATGFLVLLLLRRPKSDFFRALISEIFLWGPAVVAFVMYSMIHVELRFLPGFIILVWTALFSAIRVTKSATNDAIFRWVTCAIVILLGIQIAWSVGHSIFRSASMRPVPEREVVEELKSKGVGEGDRVAFIGFASMNHYWAHLGRLSIVAEVPGDQVPDFLAARPEVKTKIFNIFATAGATAVLAQDLPQEELASGWKNISHTNYYVFYLKSSSVGLAAESRDKAPPSPSRLEPFWRQP